MFKHGILGGLQNLVRSFWLSATAISVLTASLFLVALFAFVTTSIGFYLRTFDRSLAINVFYNEDVESETIDVMIDDLKSLPEVSSIEFIDREQATAEFAGDEDIAASIQNLQDNDLNAVLEYIIVSPESPEDYETVQSIVESPKYEEIINEIQGTGGSAATLKQYHNWVNIGGIVLVLICALVSILVMINIIRITIYQRKNEIEIMRLVGATNGYIRGPFIFEGMYYNIIASIIVAIGFVIAFNLALPYLSDFLSIENNENTQALIRQMYFSLGITIISGIVVGMITTYMATKRYLEL